MILLRPLELSTYSQIAMCISLPPKGYQAFLCGDGKPVMGKTKSRSCFCLSSILEKGEFGMSRRIIGTMMILLTLALSLPLTQPTARGSGPPYSWTGPTDIDPHLGQDNLPTAVQASNGTLWLAWQTFRFSTTGRPDIIYKTLTNGTWSSDNRITSSGYNTAPALAQLKNGTIILFWSQRQTTAFNLYYERFSVNLFTGVGAWSSNVHLTTVTTFNDTAPAATVGGDGTLWLFWQRTNQSCTTTCTQTKQLYYQTLKNGSWSSATKITTDTNWNSLPSAVVTKDGLVRLAWTKGGQGTGASSIYYKTYTGTVWSGEIPIVSPPSGFGDQRPSMIQDRNGTMWLFWSRTSVSTPMFIIFSKFSVDNGQTWSLESQLTNEASGIDSQQPAAVQANSVAQGTIIADKKIYLFYSSDRTNSDYDIWSLVSPSISPVHDLGLTFVSPSISQLYTGGLGSIGQSSNTTVAVTVVNYGDFGEKAQASVTVSNTTNTSLGSQALPVGIGGSVSFIFSWNTTDAKPGRYNLSVNAISTNSTETLGNRGDNNVFVKNSIWLLPWGDVDQDGNVVLQDVSVFIFDFGFTPAMPSRWNPFCDINNNGIIDIIDVGIAVKNFGIYT
jgi:hypothetical protein